MATIDRYVDPDVVGGAGDGTSWGDAYSSLNAWEAAEQCDLTDNGGDIMVVHCRASSGTADTTATTIVGWTVSSTCYIQIQVDVADRHSGTYNVAKYRIEVNGKCIGCEEEYIRIIGLQFKMTKAAWAWSDECLDLSVNTTVGYHVQKCIFLGVIADNADSNYAIFSNSVTGGAVYIWNNIFYDYICTPNTTYPGAIYIGAITATPVYIYSNTFHNNSIGVNSQYAGTVVKNNLIQSSGQNAYTGSFAATSTHNIGEKAAQELCFGAKHEDGKTTDGDEAGKLVDSSETFPNVVVGNAVENVTDSTYTYVTSIAEAGSGKLGVNDDIFDNAEEYNVYTNKFGSVTFSGEAGDDFHLDSADTMAKEQGTTTSGEGAPLDFTDDIDGDTRS